LQDKDGTHGRTYQSIDAHLVQPGQIGTEKFRKEGIDPRSTQLLVRVLQVKFADSSTWQSAKLQSSKSLDRTTEGNSSPADGLAK
jgi:hypothetical protein